VCWQPPTHDLRENGSRTGNFARICIIGSMHFPSFLPAAAGKRKADIPEFVQYFVQEFASSMDKTIEIISEETMRMLVEHAWPREYPRIAKTMLSEG